MASRANFFAKLYCRTPWFLISALLLTMLAAALDAQGTTVILVTSLADKVSTDGVIAEPISRELVYVRDARVENTPTVNITIS